MADVKTKPVRRKRSTAATTDSSKTTAPPKKAAAKKAPPKKAANKPPAKTAAKKTSKPGVVTKTKSPAAKKVAAKKAPSRQASYEPHPLEMNDYGFVAGSDSAIISEALIAGGTDRNDVNRIAAEIIEKQNGLVTRAGNEKYVPSMVSSILSRMLTTGDYEIIASWQLVPVEKPVRKSRKK